MQITHHYFHGRRSPICAPPWLPCALWCSPGELQTGKTTLAQEIGRENDRFFITLDRSETLELAERALEQLWEGLERVIINEVSMPSSGRTRMEHPPELCSTPARSGCGPLVMWSPFPGRLSSGAEQRPELTRANLLAQAKTDGRQSRISKIRALIPELLP